jgi:hypothetical protein
MGRSGGLIDLARVAEVMRPGLGQLLDDVLHGHSISIAMLW